MMTIWEKLARCSSPGEIQRMVRGTGWELIETGEVERLREALIAFKAAKASVGANSYDGVDEHTRYLLDHADAQAGLALGSVCEANHD